VERDGRVPSSEEELLGRVQADPSGAAGRQAASELLGRYQRRIYLWCLRYVRDHDRALDVAQDVMVNAFRGMPRFAGRSRFSSWLFAIARNRCRDLARAPSLLADPDAELEEIPDPAPDPGDDLDLRTQEDRVVALIREHLEPDEQEAIWLRCWEQLPVAEITRLLAVPGASGARGLLQSARRKLRAALKDEGAGP
jgi:RNA polymerase sigma-70 factor (ECF subfamily)